MGYKKKHGNSKDKGQPSILYGDNLKDDAEAKTELKDSERKLINQVMNVLTNLIWRYASQWCYHWEWLD